MFATREDAVAWKIECEVEVRGGFYDYDSVACGEGLGDEFCEVNAGEGGAYYEDGFALWGC